MNDRPPPIPIEVLPPEPPGAPPPHAAPRGRVPIHPMAATLLLIVDNLWNLADWMVIDWIITIPLSFLTVFFPTFFIQRFVQRDGLGSAFAKALLLGVIAAVPTSITGTPVGLLLLAWAGIKKSQQ
jgi:hypothetical protein